jgi:hypothetical protein
MYSIHEHLPVRMDVSFLQDEEVRQLTPRRPPRSRKQGTQRRRPCSSSKISRDVLVRVAAGV